MPVYRKLLPTELPRYRAHLLRLDKADRYARFTGTVSDEGIKAHCGRLDWGRTLLIGAFDGGELRGAIELCTDRRLWPDEAEFGVSVEKGWQGTGIGGELIRRVFNAARNRTVRHLHMLCLADNRRMRVLARRHGAAVDCEGAEVFARFDLPPPNQFSVALEALEDGAGAFNAMLARLGSGARVAA